MRHKYQHICGPEIIENYQDFSIGTESFYRPCSVNLITLIHLLMNTLIQTNDITDTHFFTEIFSTSV